MEGIWKCLRSNIFRVLCKSTYERKSKLLLLSMRDINFVNNKHSLLFNTVVEYDCIIILKYVCLCIYFFCFHYQRLNIVWMALKQWSFISCENRPLETTSASNCNRKGNYFLISHIVLYFQGQSDKTFVTFHLYYKNESWLKHLFIIHSLEKTLLIIGF